MFLIRILSFVVGLITLLGAFFQLMPEAEYRLFAGLNTVFYLVAAILSFSAVYFFMAVSGRRTSRSFLRRALAAGFTALHFGACAWIIQFYPQPYLIGVAGFLLCFTVLLFSLFVLPRKGRRSYTYLRRHDERAQMDPSKP